MEFLSVSISKQSVAEVVESGIQKQTDVILNLFRIPRYFSISFNPMKPEVEVGSTLNQVAWRP